MPFFVVPAIADTTIPLNEIWGFNLPDTRDVMGIPHPEKPEGIGQTFAFLNQQRESNVEQIRLALAMKPPGERASPGFVIAAQPDSRMLMAVYAYLRGKPNPLRHNPEGQYTLVFFSHPLSYYARLREVKRDGNEITVLYQFEPHTTPEATSHFALIPLEQLSAGEYHVDYQQIPLDAKYREKGFEPVHPEATEIVCRDFSFTVTEPPENEPKIEGATFIPLREIWAYEMPGTRDATLLGAVKTPFGRSNATIKALTRLFTARLQKREKAGPAFVVEGNGETALKNMVAGLDSEPEEYLPANTDISLVFYAHFNSYYVGIDAVKQIGKKFIVPYQFVSHHQGNMTFHFALIPLGKLPPGEYKVEMEQLPTIDELGRRVEHREDLSRNVCQSSTFHVREEGLLNDS
jgi:hypothetical protein